MNNINQKLNSLGLEIPSILLPKTVDEKWPVIACDQFTQDRDYWAKAKTAAAGSPSTLNLIFPEVFLADENPQDKIADIHLNMKRYLQDGVFAQPCKGFFYIERDTPYQKKRRGLVAAIDLEQYEWHPDSRPLIRCTEGTVADRLPPRMDIRRGAPLELPHVLVLVDDDTDSLLPALADRAQKNKPIYNTSLMMSSGSVSGWLLNSEDDMSFIAEKLDELFRRSVTRYTENGKLAASQPFLFAVGDGNHSLASAKGIWEEHKAAGKTDHSCRYALVEIENIYDPAIEFEPIHRVVFDVGFDKIISVLSHLPGFSSRPADSKEELARIVRDAKTQGNCFGIICENRCAVIETSAAGISTACLQPLLDDYVKDKTHLIDYIHDEDEVFRLAKNRDAGILLPPVQKSGLFDTVARLGPLPRKSFSMGHSCEKRFYLECRQLGL